MKLVNPLPMVVAAWEQGYAVPAFNTNGGDYDIVRAALEAAQELSAPMILQVYQPNAQYRGLRYCAALTRSLIEDLDIRVPVALHVDHGKDLAFCRQAMQAGFTSVMIDASHHPLEDNIRLTRQVIAAARRRKVAVEAEVGHVKGNEPPGHPQIGCIPAPPRPSLPPAKTVPADAVELVRRTHVDMLAVSVGSTHGGYQRQSGFDFKLLADLHRQIPVPLVMHGTCGISLKDLTRLARGGMAKINVGEPFRYNFIRHFLELSDEMEHMWHPWRILQEVKNRLGKEMRELIQAMGCDGKANQ